MAGSPSQTNHNSNVRINSEEDFICPNCGEVVPAKALACPACGSDEHTGWSDETEYDDLDLPEGYDGSGSIDIGTYESRLQQQKYKIYRAVALVLILALLLFLLSPYL